VSEIDVGRLYRDHRERVIDLVRPVPAERLLEPAPACPGWTVHDIVSHLAGNAADAIAGRLGGIPSDAQTAEQVAARRGQPTTVVLREWERSASQFELVLTKTGASILPAAIDVAVHEHDIRGALDLPGEHESETVAITAHRMLDRWMRSLPGRGVPVPCVVDPAGAVLAGDPGSTVRWTASTYEVFRTAFGRRSAAQFARGFEGADPGPYLAELLVFGITPIDLYD
jgi:uncharacterized protein (TIGR03083 family)